jgi:hypothetical protein
MKCDGETRSKRGFGCDDLCVDKEVLLNGTYIITYIGNESVSLKKRSKPWLTKTALALAVFLEGSR